MRPVFFVGSLAASIMTLGSVNACSSTCEDTLICGDASGVDSGLDSTRDTSSNDGSTCDSKTSNCIDAATGVFVSTTTGADSNAGTQAAPFKTIGNALVQAKAAGRVNVYVCSGTYAENIDLEDSINLLGGFACADWSYAPTNVVTVSPAVGLPLHVESTTTNISDFAFVAADAVAPGDSSVAMFVDTSTVTLLRVSATAGKGAAGSSGTAGSNYAAVSQSDVTIRGTNASGINGGVAHICALCTDTKNSIGGQGGLGGGAPGDGTSGLPNNDGGAPNDGVGGMRAGTNNAPACQTGDNGANGATGTVASSTNALGALTSAGWNASSGANGANGLPGQGGGGGGGGYDNTNTIGGAAGGGCGGCGGAAGGGGAGGGGSIAVLAYDATVTLVTSDLHAASGGAGGSGVAGQTGQPGGLTGSSNAGCNGGMGGTGGAGGSGAGGAGGVSAGVLWKGSTAPTLDSATQTAATIGPNGAKGTGGSPGTNDGIDGVAQMVLQVQ